MPLPSRGERPKQGEPPLSFVPDPNTPITGTKALLIAALGLVVFGPNLYLVFERIGPGAWLVGAEEEALGGYWPFLSALVLILGEIVVLAIPLLLVQWTVRLATGRTIREHLETRRLRRARRAARPPGR